MVHRSWLRHICLIVVSFLLVKCSKLNQSNASCPHGCKCDAASVNCLHSNLTAIPQNLPGGKQIRKINFARNKVQYIKAELNGYTELRSLDFTNNNISLIEGAAFSKLVSLEILRLSRNFIVKTDRFTFTNLLSLKHLDISYNALRCVKTENFKDLRNLISLDLTLNKLSLFELDAFHGLDSLQVLNLTRNYLDIFPVEPFETLTSLTVLILDDNKIRSLPTFAFSKLMNLKYLSLTGNRLQTISSTSLLMSSGTSIPLKELHLRGTDLESIPGDILQTLTTLTVLDLSQTRISTVPNYLLDGLSSLRYFTMTSSKFLTLIEHSAFEKLHSLIEIVISENILLSDTQNISFSSAKWLKRVDLSKNSITTFSRDLVDWTSDVVVDVRGNKFKCDCSLSWLPTVLPTIKNNQTKTNMAQLYCDSPLEVIGQPVSSLYHSYFRCSANKTKIKFDVISRAQIGAISAVAACLILVTLALLVKFRKRLCMLIRSQYRYSAYRNKNGVFTVNADNDDLNVPDEEEPMEEMHVFTDHLHPGPDVILVTNTNRRH